MDKPTYNLEKNYYHILDVKTTATIEELKAAHVRLALQHHPDLTDNEESVQAFLDVTEAWQVLSHAEVKAVYDRNFLKQLDVKKISTGTIPPLHSAGFSLQRDHLHVVHKSIGSSHWKEMQDKYKEERWQKLPLDRKKLNRVRPTQSMGKFILFVSIPIIFAGSFAFAATRK